MEILVIGNEINYQEFKEKFKIGDKRKDNLRGTNISFLNQSKLKAIAIEKAKVIFDFSLDEIKENLELYKNRKDKIIFCNIPKTSLAALSYYNGPVKCILVGFNGLPTLFNRTVLELSVKGETDKAAVIKVCEELSTDYAFVEDRVGMVTPRILSMIINEAYYTIMEKTASIEDIDLALKLGTSYPFGPFEFVKRIGLQHIYELLEALYEDTKDERYKICPLMKKQYLEL